MDFTLSTYDLLLMQLKEKGYTFQSVEQFLTRAGEKVVMLRHDVDRSPANALITAKMEYKLGISGTYYFKTNPNVWDTEVMMEIASLGHEIGYHYNDLNACNGDHEKAISSFLQNLTKFAGIYPVKTICMDGSPLSRYDNKDLWVTYNYRNYGIVGEPYLDIDFTEVYYLTDTGRRWDGGPVSIRDKVVATPLQQSFRFHSTRDIINNLSTLPNKIMFTVHPQRWTNRPVPWLRELVAQSLKNKVKWVVVWRNTAKNDL